MYCVCINLVHFVFIEQLCNDYETVCVGHVLEALCPLCPVGNLLLYYIVLLILLNIFRSFHFIHTSCRKSQTSVYFIRKRNHADILVKMLLPISIWFQLDTGQSMGVARKGRGSWDLPQSNPTEIIKDKTCTHCMHCALG